jgi:hypothetical protein
VSYWLLKQQLIIFAIFAIFAKVLHSNFGLTTNPLLHISAPISPRQQRHLAFISEFNVQLLYLSGLKNVVADFFPAPYRSLLKQSSRRRIQWISKRWLPSKTDARKHSAC